MTADSRQGGEGSRLAIPEEAREAAAHGLAEHYTNISYIAGENEVYTELDCRDDASAALEAAAALIVAAELERLAAEFGDFNRQRLRTMSTDKKSVDIPAQNMELARVGDLLATRAAELRDGAQ